MQGASTAHPAHHLVKDEQDAMLVADLSYTFEITGHRRHRAQRCPHHLFGHEGDDTLAADLGDLGLELQGEALSIVLPRLVRSSLAILIDWRHMMCVDQQRHEWSALEIAT